MDSSLVSHNDKVQSIMKDGDLNALPTRIRWPPRTSKSETDKLHSAVLMGKARKIREAVSNGISPDVRNREGQTGLFVASFLGKKDTVATLLKLGANPNARCSPEGHTAVHGVCYIGSLEILRMLLAADGDLRLTDIKRQRPIDWIEFQGDVNKRKATRDFIERIRLCIMKTECAELRQELQTEMETPGIWFGNKMWNWLGKCGSNSLMSEESLNCQLLVSTGFGKLFYQSGTKCVEAIGLPSVNETVDLKYDSNPKAPSWICGKFSTFIPMLWDKRNTAVTLKALRTKSVEEAVPDVLIVELDILVRLQHPQILMLLAVCQEENFDSLSLVFEKIELGSLYFFLHQQRLRMKSAFATDIIIQISEALDFVHGSGFLHCGISSHAVMLVGENQAKLACFEYAIPEHKASAEAFLSSRHPWLQSDSHLSVIRHWMAPEVLTGTHHHSQISDVYSLCSVMWELVVGEVPWKDYDFASLKFLMEGHPELPLLKDVIPPLWLSLLQVGLKPRWEDRDLDFKELRYMMSLARERSCSGASERKSAERVSVRSVVAGTPGTGTIGSMRSSSAKLKPVDVVDSPTLPTNKHFQIL